MAAQAGEHTDLGVDDVAWLHVVAGPCRVEAHRGEVRDPVGEDFAANLQELLAVVLQVLTGLEGVAVGRGAADDLSRVQELLSVDGAEAFVVTAVDDHV